MRLHLMRRAAAPLPCRGLQLGVGATLCLLAALASAHPSLTGSTPRAGAALDAPPGEIRLQFNEPVEAAFTTIQLVDASGAVLAGQTTQRDKDDPRTVAMPLPVLARCSDKARWSAAGRDGHRVKGEFSFAVP